MRRFYTMRIPFWQSVGCRHLHAVGPVCIFEFRWTADAHFHRSLAGSCCLVSIEIAAARSLSSSLSRPTNNRKMKNWMPSIPRMKEEKKKKKKTSRLAGVGPTQPLCVRSTIYCLNCILIQVMWWANSGSFNVQPHALSFAQKPDQFWIGQRLVREFIPFPFFSPFHCALRIRRQFDLLSRSQKTTTRLACGGNCNLNFHLVSNAVDALKRPSVEQMDWLQMSSINYLFNAFSLNGNGAVSAETSLLIQLIFAFFFFKIQSKQTSEKWRVTRSDKEEEEEEEKSVNTVQI